VAKIEGKRKWREEEKNLSEIL